MKKTIFFITIIFISSNLIAQIPDDFDARVKRLIEIIHDKTSNKFTGFDRVDIHRYTLRIENNNINNAFVNQIDLFLDINREIIKINDIKIFIDIDNKHNFDYRKSKDRANKYKWAYITALENYGFKDYHKTETEYGISDCLILTLQNNLIILVELSERITKTPNSYLKIDQDLAYLVITYIIKKNNE